MNMATTKITSVATIPNQGRSTHTPTISKERFKEKCKNIDEKLRNFEITLPQTTATASGVWIKSVIVLW